MNTGKMKLHGEITKNKMLQKDCIVMETKSAGESVTKINYSQKL